MERAYSSTDSKITDQEPVSEHHQRSGAHSERLKHRLVWNLVASCNVLVLYKTISLRKTWESLPVGLGSLVSDFCQFFQPALFSSWKEKQRKTRRPSSTGVLWHDPTQTTTESWCCFATEMFHVNISLALPNIVKKSWYGLAVFLNLFPGKICITDGSFYSFVVRKRILGVDPFLRAGCTLI